MRIALFTDTYLPDINGVVSSIVTLQKELERNGHTVFIVTTHSSLIHTSFENNILRLTGVELKSLYGYVLTSPIHIWALNTIRDMQLDIIHAHTEYGIGIFARIVARLLKLPLVTTYHTTLEDYTHYVNIFNLKSFEKFARKSVARLSKLYGDACTELIVPSHKTKEMLVRYGIKKDIYVIPTGLDLAKFDRDENSIAKSALLREHYGVLPEELLVLYVGRIAKEKSIDLVIEGFAKIDAKHSAKLMIVGSGPEEEHLREFVDRLKLSDRVIFTGKKPPVEVPIHYHAADAFASASLTETQGMTFIEALASELPVFARPDEVLNGLVIEGETGYYFTSPTEFASKVEAYMELSPETKQHIRENAKQHVLEYDSRVFYQSVIKVYYAAVSHYHNSYSLINIHAKNDAVECIFTGKNENIKVFVSIETFLKKGLRRDKVISEETLQELMLDEKVVKAYQACIRKLTLRDRTRKEMYDFLTQESELPIKQVNELIEILEQRGYVDDVRYVNSAVMNLRSLLQGRKKIVRSMMLKGIPFELIEKALNEDVSDDEVNLALRWAEKTMPTIKDKSLRLKKQLLRQKMHAQGFDSSVCEIVMARLNFADDERQELERLQKTAQKVRKRYETKSSGSKLRNQIFRYLSSQGYESEDIYLVLNEMEWKDE
ncbi:MAG: RecX family transcriptional regulator [Erysipelotrichaceae bacterium]